MHPKSYTPLPRLVGLKVRLAGAGTTPPPQEKPMRTSAVIPALAWHGLQGFGLEGLGLKAEGVGCRAWG